MTVFVKVDKKHVSFPEHFRNFWPPELLVSFSHAECLRESVHSTHICTYLFMLCYVCCLPYLPSPTHPSRPLHSPPIPPAAPPPFSRGWGGWGGGRGSRRSTTSCLSKYVQICRMHTFPVNTRRGNNLLGAPGARNVDKVSEK